MRCSMAVDPGFGAGVSHARHSAVAEMRHRPQAINCRFNLVRRPAGCRPSNPQPSAGRLDHWLWTGTLGLDPAVSFVAPEAQPDPSVADPAPGLEVKVTEASRSKFRNGFPGGGQ